MLAGICKDANGKIWVTGDNSLYYYDVPSQSFKHYFELPEDLKEYHLTEPSLDPLNADVLWLNSDGSKNVSTPTPELYGRKLLRFNSKTKAYQLYTTNPNDPNALRANCTKMLKDSLNRLWFLTNKGISLFNSKQNNFTNYDIAFPGNKVSATAIAADKNGNCWIGGNFQGLYYLNITTGTAILYKSDGQEGSLPFYRDISNLFFDRKGTLWVNMPYFGIAYLNKQKTLFAAQPIAGKSVTAKPNSGSSFKIVGVTGDSICYITDGNNLYAWHPQQNTFDKIALRKEIYKDIRTVVSSPDKTIWIGTITNGLFQYNPVTKAAINYTNNPNDSNSISSNNVRALIAIGNENLWIGTDGGGLCSFNPVTKKITRYPYASTNNGKNSVDKELNDSRIISLHVDHKAVLWIGTNDGLISKYDVKTKEFINYTDRKKGIFCATVIFEDSKQRMWIGSYLSGLFLFDRKTGTFKNYTEQDGLLHNSVLEIEEDAVGNIWCVSERGLSRLDPKTNKFTNFKNIYLDYNPRIRTIYKDANKTFRFSVESGIIHFNPADLVPNPVPPFVVIESINYRPAKDKTGKDTFLFPAAGEKISLRYDENKLGFQFVALHFADPANNQYAYQLVGYDKDWIPAGTQRTATYTNLSPGTYTFRVKAANSDGIWSTENPSITFVISPPWWQTWWAYLLYAIIFIAAISSFIAYRSAALKRENEILEQKVSHRTNQLTKSIDDLKNTQSQLVQSEKMASLGELTAGIAHEIQNPLNFVNNFSEVNNELIEELKSEKGKLKEEEVDELLNDIYQNNEKINHHGKRADAIVKGMLQHSQSSTGEKESTDINKLTDEYLRLAYHGLRAKDKSFNATLKSDFDKNSGSINIIPQDIGRVILNLITNAFYAVDEKKKSTTENYEPTVSITTKRLTDKIEISVADNGNGIPQNIIEKIFQPFFTTKPTGQGTGLGLSLAYDIVKAHGGELKVTTKENEGSEFIIQLPA